MVEKFVSVTRATLKGTILLGVAQGLLGGLAFWAVRGDVGWQLADLPTDDHAREPGRAVPTLLGITGVRLAGLHCVMKRSFSRGAVEANNGRIDALDLPEKGCLFTIDLPRIPIPAIAMI